MVLRLLVLVAGCAGVVAAQTPPVDRTSADAWRRSIERLEPKTGEGWRAAAVADVAFVDRALREHSPIGIAPSAAAIDTAVRRAIRIASERATRVTTKGGYYRTLSTLSESLSDPHAAVYFSRNWNIGLAIPDTWWAGLRVRSVNSEAHVSYVAPADTSSWQVGDVIQSCDGITLDSLVGVNIVPFGVPSAPDTPQTRRAKIPQLFLDMENPFIQRPRSCRRVRRDGAASDVALAWRVRTDDDLRVIPSAVPSAAPATFALTWAAPDVAIIRVPTFSGDAVSTAQIITLAASLREQASRLRAARLVVFDVRGNTGGSSINGDRLVEALWTPQELQRYGPPVETLQIAWRATADNLAHWQAFTAERTARGPEAKADADFGRRVVAGLTQARAKRQPLWVEKTRSINPSVARDRRRAPLFGAKVYLLSDGACISACLDFADRVLSMPGTLLAGADTDGDGLLMEVRSVPTPSGLTAIAIPQKIYLNRRRGHLERYRADVAYSGPWTDSAVMQWLLGLQ